jgi:hypothetical protein
MTDPSSIFTDPNTPATPGTNQPAGGTGGNGQPDNEIATLLLAIKNERGEPKYKNVNEALKALQHSQQFIPDLKQTQAELQAKLDEANARAARVEQLEQVVNELTQRTQTTQSTPAGLSEEQIANLVNRTMSDAQRKALEKTNVEQVVQKMQGQFGDQAEKIFYDKAKELNMTVAEFNALAARTPVAVLKLVGVGETQTQRTSPGINTAGFQPKQDTFIKRNSKSALLGVTTQDLKEESANAAQLVEELHSQGLTINSLTDPKVYFKLFK